MRFLCIPCCAAAGAALGGAVAAAEAAAPSDPLSISKISEQDIEQ